MTVPASTVLIRPLVPEDMAAYRRLRLAALADSPQSFSASVEDEAAFSDDEMAEQTVPPAPGVVFGAFMARELVGMAGYIANSRLKTRHKATMVGVYVSPVCRGGRVGRRLVEAVIDHGRSLGAILQCTVTLQNEPARRLYHALGFEPYGIERDALFVNGRFLDEELLALDLRTRSD